MQRHETERHKANVNHAALRERQDQREQAGRIDRMKEQKALFELIRDERERMVRDHAADKPRQIEDRARVIEKIDRENEQRREQEQQDRQAQPRGNVRPTEDFAPAASENREAPPVREPVPEDSREVSASREAAADRQEVFREAARDIPAERELERA